MYVLNYIAIICVKHRSCLQQPSALSQRLQLAICPIKLPRGFSSVKIFEKSTFTVEMLRRF